MMKKTRQIKGVKITNISTVKLTDQAFQTIAYVALRIGLQDVRVECVYDKLGDAVFNLYNQEKSIYAFSVDNDGRTYF